MTSCLHKLVRVCLAVISLIAFSHRIFKHKTIAMQNISRENIRQYLAYKLFLFVHIPPIFSVLLTYSLKINSLLFLAPL